MTPFTKHTGIVLPLDRDNIDTDAIIPKQFMKSIARTGFGPYLFDEWRFLDEGYYGKASSERIPNPKCPINFPRFAHASVLLAGKNFGCGSSREHAPWALYQFGIRVMIATSFADIFFNNCCKNGILPVILADEQIQALRAEIEDTLGFSLTVNLETRQVSWANGQHVSFDMPEMLRKNLLEGVDEVGATLLFSEEIKAFEDKRLSQRPWL
ncbi:3-isopropylmalate dehydratase small subunit [Caballeronia sp. LjRoot29]|uniref:3-isopropylmalate dehydratase small subunit n=1 Tax=Caballeronia sp. LjRoot29 TaxID=3342315 RepID=UPI003ECE7DE4